MPRIVALFLAITCLCMTAHAQDIRKTTGIEPTENRTWARILLPGKLLPAATQQETPPLLIAQCTRDITGKLGFELRLNYTGIDDGQYHLPWHQSTPGHIMPAPPERIEVTFEFFGYTRVKPMKRQWEIERDPPAEMTYLAASYHSRNMEETTFFLHYMRALSTLRLTHGTDAAQFDTAPFLAAIHDEPLCAGSGV